MEMKENVKSVEEFNYLFDKVGWGAWNDHITKEALDNTLYSVSIYRDGKIIAYGRLLGDKTMYLYVHDVMVVPEEQSNKIGTMVMNKLLEQVEVYKMTNPGLRVYLGASKNKEEFYKKFNFVTRKEAGLGEGMILKK